MPRTFYTATRHIPTSAGSMRLLVLRPAAHARPAVQTSGILWIHGGGYMLGMPEMVYMSRALPLVQRYGAVVVSPAYRLAPRHPYPAALCMLARDRGEVAVACQMPLYPMLDDRDTPSSRNNHAPVWNTRRNHRGWRSYLGGLSGQDVPPYASPARQTDYRGLPPTYTFVGNIEPFYDETLTYIENLKAAGVEASVDVYPGCFHAFDMLMPWRRVSHQAAEAFEAWYQAAVTKYFAPQPVFTPSPEAPQ